MTRRERLERKLELRREWAEGRIKKAAALHKQNEPFRGDYAFNTQPGHIPERARVIARTERAYEHHQMAEHHEQKADGLERQLDGSVFSDDPDAIEQLKSKIAQAEKLQEAMTAGNKIIRNNGLSADEKVAKLIELGLREKLARSALEPDFAGRIGFPGYALQNNNANIRRMKERIEQIKRRQARTEQAEANAGVFVTMHGEWCSVTFAEKPEREILTALKAAGFRWGAGSWSGYADKLPACVQSGRDGDA
jgi:hypothetical protein